MATAKEKTNCSDITCTEPELKSITFALQNTRNLADIFIIIIDQ